MIAESKITDFFCVIDEFNKNFDKEMSNHALISPSGKRRRNREGVDESNKSDYGSSFGARFMAP